MQNFIYHSHCIDLPGLNRLLRVSCQIALLIHFLSKKARPMKIGKNDITIKPEQGLVKLIAITCLTGNMELEHGSPPEQEYRLHNYTLVITVQSVSSTSTLLWSTIKLFSD